jgi:hypothetical protein
MNMTKIERDYSKRSEFERSCFEEDTWCDECNQADIGLFEPHEYEEGGKVFIEGKCRKCGGHVVSEIIEQSVVG